MGWVGKAGTERRGSVAGESRAVGGPGKGWGRASTKARSLYSKPAGTIQRRGRGRGRSRTRKAHRAGWGPRRPPRRPWLAARPAHPLARRELSAPESSCHPCPGGTAWNPRLAPSLPSSHPTPPPPRTHRTPLCSWLGCAARGLGSERRRTAADLCAPPALRGCTPEEVGCGEAPGETPEDPRPWRDAGGGGSGARRQTRAFIAAHRRPKGDRDGGKGTRRGCLLAQDAPCPESGLAPHTSGENSTTGDSGSVRSGRESFERETSWADWPKAGLRPRQGFWPMTARRGLCCRPAAAAGTASRGAGPRPAGTLLRVGALYPEAADIWARVVWPALRTTPAGLGARLPLPWSPGLVSQKVARLAC